MRNLAVGQLVRLGDVPVGATVSYDYREGVTDVVTVMDSPSKPGYVRVKFAEFQRVPVEGTFGFFDHWAKSSEVRILSLP